MTEGNEGIQQASFREEEALLPITSSGASDVGRVRSENQDSFASVRNEAYEAFIVADGMGGVEGGAIASQLAIKKFIASLNGDISQESLTRAIQEANRAVFKRGQEDEHLAGMGTTFVALCFTGNGALLAHVGDSRAYRLRGEALEQLTRDHTLVQELVDSGALSPTQVENHPVSHMLTRSLGPTSSVIPECRCIHGGLQKGDRFLLCSDGLYNHVQADEIAQIIGGREDEQAVQELISLANARGGSDNITVMIVSLADDMRTEPSLDPQSNPEEVVQVPTVDPVGMTSQPSSQQVTVRNALILGGLVAVTAVVGYLFSVPIMKEEVVLSRKLHPAEQKLVNNAGESTLSPSPSPIQQARVVEQTVTLGTGLPSHPISEEERAARNREKREELLFHLGLFETPRQLEVEELLADQSGRQLEIESDLNHCQARLDKANRRLAVWYERKRLLQEKTPLAIAIEVAAISEGVGALKEKFDEVTWEYLRKVEALRYEPENKEVEEQTFILRKKREDYLQKLREEIRETVQSESLAAEKEVAELTIEKDMIASNIAKLKRAEKILQVLAQGTAIERKSLQGELNKELERIEHESVSLGGNDSSIAPQ